MTVSSVWSGWWISTPTVITRSKLWSGNGRARAGEWARVAVGCRRRASSDAARLMSIPVTDDAGMKSEIHRRLLPALEPIQ